MTTDEYPQPVASAEAGEIESETEEIPGQDSLFPNLHREGEGENGGQYIGTTRLGEKVEVHIPPEPEWMAGLPDWQKAIVRPEGYVPSPEQLQKERDTYNRHYEVNHSAYMTTQAMHAGQRDAVAQFNHAIRPESPWYQRSLGDAETIKEGLRDKVTFLPPPVEHEDAPEKGFLPDEESFFRIFPADAPSIGEGTGMPVVGFTFTALLPDGSIVEGGLQAPCGHEGDTPHGVSKNVDLLGEIAALALNQFLGELAKRKARASAMFDAQNPVCHA